MSCSRLLYLARLSGRVLAQQQITSGELLRLQLSGHGTGINTATVLRGAMQLTHGAAAGQAAARFSTALPPAGRQQLMQQLMQRQRAHVQSVSSRWASVEAKVVALVNSCMLAPAGQTVLGAFLPFWLLAALFPSRISARAYELPASHIWEYEAAHSSSSSSGAVFTPAVVRIRAQQAAQTHPLATMLSQARGAISFALAHIASEVAIALRGVYLAALFAPLLLSSPLVFSWGVGRQEWLLLLRWTLEQAGPAFIKWGQWGSTRPDLFPRDVCGALESLQSSAPSHAPDLSVSAVEAAFSRPLRELFSAWEAEPIASGSIAQIHRARLSPQAAASCGVRPGTLVAVKVRHPGVEALMAQDFVLMARAARLAGRLPGLKSLRLEESVRQFGGPLQEQLDLSVEAQHLSKFARNFRSWRNVKFPTPIYPLVRPSVLVESFEPGAAIQGYVAASAAIAARAAVAALADEPTSTSSSSGGGGGGGTNSSSSSSGGGGGGGTNSSSSSSSSRGSIDDAVVSNGVGPCRMAAAADAARADSLARFEASVAQRSSDRETARLRGAIAEAGMHVYLKMLLKDNFIHADMHPGNILVREVDRSGGIAERFALLLKQLSAGLPLPGVREVFRNVVLPPTPQLVLLDTGMIAELSKADQRSVVEFFKALTAQNGEALARSILSMSEAHTCAHPEQFVVALKDMFAAIDPERIRTRTGEVLQDMIEQLRQHEVTLKSTVSTVVVTTLVLEGWSRELDPDLHIMDTLRDMLAVDWKERLSSAVDKVMASGSLAVV